MGLTEILLEQPEVDINFTDEDGKKSNALTFEEAY